jgi:hypothetical protein
MKIFKANASIILSILLTASVLSLFLIWIPVFFLKDSGWLNFSKGMYSGYPADLHARMAAISVSVFLSVFILKGKISDWFFPVMTSLLFILSFFSNPLFFYGVLAVILTSVLFIQWPDPETETKKSVWINYLLQIALLSGITGSLFLIFSMADHRPWLFETGKSLLFNGYILLSVPALFLYTEKNSSAEETYSVPGFIMVFSLVIFLASFAGEILIFVKALPGSEFHFPGFMRFISVSIWIFTLFPLRRRFRRLPDIQDLIYIIFTLNLAIGPLGHSLVQDFRGHFSHVAFIGGIAPLMMIIAHRFFIQSGSDIIPGRWLYVIFSAILLATPLRIAAGWNDFTDLGGLMIASVIMLFAFSVFLFFTLKNRKFS